ncbi:MAG: LPXTG cell wall anchor domain-containing protein [Aristaeellaceae bacterium]
MNHTLKRMLAVVLCLMLSLTTFTSASAEATLNIQHRYSNAGYTFEKVSHASSGTETGDGVVDYLGDHQIRAYVDGVSEVGNADTVQSYSYCAVACGDWVYMGTMYGALSAYTQVQRAMTSMGISVELAQAVVDAMFNGKLNRGQEADGYYAGSVFFKFNIKTGETKILMSREMYEKGECAGVPIFRAACEYNGKLYFVGLVSNGTALATYNGYPLSQAAALNLEIMMQTGVPSIYEVDPRTDKVTKVYECVNTQEYRQLNGNMNGKSVFTSTRAIGTYKDYLIAGGIRVGAARTDGYAPGDACILATNNPASGDFKVIASMKDLFDYPAIWRDGSSGGGGIYQVVEYNDSLYVAIVSGTADTMNPDTHQYRPFAVVRGDYDPSKGSVDNRNAWTWVPVIGDLADGARYTFGIDPERTASSACTLQIYGDYLYIGEYNDVNGSLTGILQRQDFSTLRHNLDQSINLYRMDKNENIELVVGDKTAMFPNGSISGWKSGYNSHMNQYTWMTTVFEDKMYLSTMDETSLTHVFAQLVNGELLTMSKEEWISQINYIRVIVQLLTQSQTMTTNEILQQEGERTPYSRRRSGSAVSEDTAKKIIDSAVDNTSTVPALADEQISELAADILSGALNVENSPLPADVLQKLNKLNDMLTEISGLLETSDFDAFQKKYTEAMELYLSIRDLLPENLQGIYDLLLKMVTLDNFKDLAVCLKHMRTSKAGFDLYVIEDTGNGNVKITSVTENGFGDRYNHGLRVFAATNDYLMIGTANPFLGTQIWRMKATNPKEPYQITKGSGIDVVQGTEATFVSNAPMEKFWRVEVDGVEIASKNYKVVSGSTAVTLTGSYTATLPLGQHTINIVSTDGNAACSFNVLPAPDLPQTGDNSNLMLWLALLAASTVAIAMILRKKKQA